MPENIPPSGKLAAALLRDLLAGASVPSSDVKLPPMVGEDAGVIDIAAGALIVSTDPITLTSKDVGAHAVAINANDVAVMGARPRWFLAVVLLPPGTSEAEIRELFEAMHVSLMNLGVSLVGGHTEITDAVTQPVVVGQMMGLREDGEFVPTGGLSRGDAVVQVGPAPIEGSAVLAAEASGAVQTLPRDVLDVALEALHNPGISVVEAALKATELGAIAMHDPTEGGLSAGLHELAEASGLSLRVDTDAVLWFEPGIRICKALNLNPWGVLASGTLLAGFPSSIVDSACHRLHLDGFSATVIAVAENGRGVRLADGTNLVRFERDELSRPLQS